jgi:4-hydroxy-2-oxoheptanedioate aldolase
MPVRINRMKQKLRQGQPAFGGLVRTPEPTLAEAPGYAGYDYVGLDAEHGGHSVETLDALILTAYAGDITPIVRVNENSPGLIMRVLDNRGSQFGAIAGDECFKPINDEVAVILMMEEADAVENIGAITDVAGITALSIGLSDLSGSLGVPGQANHPWCRPPLIS